MTLRTCLLVTDDPDDQSEFSEALYEVSADAILLSVVHSKKAMELLQSETHIPNYIFLDLSMLDLDPGAFIIEINQKKELREIPLIVYGEHSEYEKVKNLGVYAFLTRDCKYSELRNFLIKIINP